MVAPRMFMWRHERFWYNPSKREWTRKQFDLHRSYQAIHAMSVERLEETLSEVVSLDAAFSRALTYGDNQLDVNAKPFPHLVLAELLKPFFAFQVPPTHPQAGGSKQAGPANSQPLLNGSVCDAEPGYTWWLLLVCVRGCPRCSAS